ncbi:hypothetical protein SAMN05216236_12415 [Sedimentitalea nanhaiensis]|uniref:Uncharacterized protein n=2 Tax=Sedimentitalea nanhaiensis TaxID=999627 RepID=A0A1I7D7Z7_9RHOB|nr:hypothetical protein SAMN05216236_12415 [Sedimentitalea nanhaiensis]
MPEWPDKQRIATERESKEMKVRMRFIWTAVYVALLTAGGFPGYAADVALGAKDLRRIGTGPLIAQDVAGLPADPDLPVVDPNAMSPEARQLQGLVARGVSQGFGGILYDNRDRAHSLLSRSLFPNLTFLTYDAQLTKQGLDYGLAGGILIPALVFGNSSTALTSGLNARSQVRLAMTTPGGPARGFRDYIANSLYIYPEHRDHDAVDMYPANWPYTLTSQGSSGSDGPFMAAVAMTLAAFPADTRAALETAGLVAPTVQMILRRNLSMVRTRANYLSAAAHPTVFSSEWLQPGRMIGQAAGLRPEDIPPLVRLRVLDEGFVNKAGLPGKDEHLFTTPSAIARIWRNLDWQREMTVTAAPTGDPNGHDLRFDWILLRGDPEHVRIEPLDQDGVSARITVDWHDMFVLPARSTDDIARQSSRVDIGVFAWNGRADSAPAIISISFPTHQSRQYQPGPDGVMRLIEVDYDAIERGAYFDPVLHWSAPWTDRFAYLADGTLGGWSREENGMLTQFDARGNPVAGGRVIYQLGRDRKKLPQLQYKIVDEQG